MVKETDLAPKDRERLWVAREKYRIALAAYNRSDGLWMSNPSKAEAARVKRLDEATTAAYGELAHLEGELGLRWNPLAKKELDGLFAKDGERKEDERG